MPDPVRLSITVKRFQRVINPPERLVLAILGIAMSVALLAWVVYLVFVASSVEGWLVLLFSAPVAWFMFWDPVMSLVLAVFGGQYINTIIIDGDRVSVGINEPQVTFRRNSLKVGRGLAGTIIIRNILAEEAVVLQREIMPFDELKELVEGKSNTDGSEEDGITKTEH